MNGIFWARSHLGNKSTFSITFISEVNGLWNTWNEAMSHYFPFWLHPNQTKGEMREEKKIIQKSQLTFYGHVEKQNKKH